jgi:hypothetical protein
MKAAAIVVVVVVVILVKSKVRRSRHTQSMLTRWEVGVMMGLGAAKAARLLTTTRKSQTQITPTEGPGGSIRRPEMPTKGLKGMKGEVELEMN